MIVIHSPDLWCIASKWDVKIYSGMFHQSTENQLDEIKIGKGSPMRIWHISQTLQSKNWAANKAE